MRKTFFTISITTLTLLLSIAITLAQGVCDGFIDLALDAVAASCDDLGRNQACYGYDRVEASFLETVDADFFTQPADVADVSMLETIRTVPFNAGMDEWGVAIMVLQANMPETLPGQNVTFILMGDTELENAVAPDDAFEPVEGIDVTVTFAQGAAVRSGPGDNFNTIGGVVVGTIFATDGVSVDGDWLRIVWEERPAWIRRTTVEAIPEIGTLPTLSADLNTPMQAFYLRTGIGQPSCNQVPDNSLLVQGPEDINIELTVNGANIELGSSGALRVVEINGEPQLEIVVFDGEFVVKADEFNPQDVVIRAGERSRLCLQDNNNEGVNGEADDLLVTCAASAPERVDFGEFGDDWCVLENLPENLLNYPLSTCYDNTHTIQSGENLFRISQFYCVSLDELIALNGITDPTQISVGQILILPASACDDGTGSTRPPAGTSGTAVTNPDNNGDDDGVVSPTTCISLISPLAPVNSGNQTFSWTAYAGEGAISYELIFYTFEGTEAEFFLTDSTSYTLNLGRQTSTGGEFSWEVLVLLDGEFLCSSGRSPTLMRTGEMNPEASANIQVSCVDDGFGTVNATISWSGLPQGETINATLTNGTINSGGGPFTTASGQEPLMISASGPATIRASSSLGDSASNTC